MKGIFRVVEDMGDAVGDWAQDHERTVPIVAVVLILVFSMILATSFLPIDRTYVVVTAIRSDSTYDMGSVVATTLNSETVIVLDIPLSAMPYMQVGDSLRVCSSYPNSSFVEFIDWKTEFRISPTGERL